MVRKAKLKMYSILGDVDQAQRVAIMDKPKERGGSPRVLVATDIAARGLNSQDVELVINFDAPRDLEFYPSFPIHQSAGIIQPKFIKGQRP